MGLGRGRKPISEQLEEIDITLTLSSKTAASIGDEFLVYLLDMVILHVRKKAVTIAEAREVNSVAHKVNRVAAA